MSDTNYYCGVTLELGGKEISLNPSTAINEVKTKGMECELPDRVDIGQVSEMFDGVTKSLGADQYTWDSLGNEIKDIPVLSDAVELLGDANLAVEQFHLKTAPSHTKDGENLVAIAKENQEQTKYTVGLSMNWTGESGTLFGDLKLKGIFFKVSNEE